MATAKKLPSGSWRCLIYTGEENGKRKYKSFTASTKKEAEFMATQFVMNQKEHEEKNTLKFKDAMKHYNSPKENVLSPLFDNFLHYNKKLPGKGFYVVL